MYVNTRRLYRIEALSLVALATGLGVLEVGLLFLAVEHKANVQALMGVHFLVCAGLWLQASRKPWRFLQAYKLLLVLSTALFSIVGACAVLVGYVFTLTLDKLKPAHFDETYDELFDISPEDADTHVFRHVQHYNVVGAPLVVNDQLLDMFQHGSSIEKQTVLSVVNNSYQPKFAKILRLALQDTDNVIRIQAAAILADLEQRQQQKLIELEAAAKNKKTTQAQLELAQHYDDISHSGVVDQVRRSKLLNKAAAIFEKVHAEDTASADIAKKLARVYYRLDRAPDAARVIAPFAETLEDISLSLWYLELLFVTGKTKELRQMAAKLWPQVENNHAYPIKLQKAVQLWAI